MADDLKLAEYYENAVLTSDGQERLIAWHNALLRDQAGNIVGTLSSGEDITDRRRAEEEVRRYHACLEELVGQRTREVAEVNARLEEELAFTQHVVTGVPAVICRISPDGTTTFINPAGERITGYRAEELVGRNWWRVFYPGEEYRQVEALFAALNRGDVRDYEMGLTTKTGARRTISWNSINRFDAAGQPVEIVGFGNDVTERRQAEEALRESKEFLDKIINSIGDPILVKDRQHRMVLVNDAECALTGHPREEVLGQTDYGFFPKEQVDVFWEKDEAVFATGAENINEEEITDAQGATRTIVTKKTLYMDPTGKQFIVGVIRDITERKHAEVALRTSEANFRTLAETIPVAITITSGPRVLYVNSAAEAITGYDRAELLGLESYWNVVHPDFRDLVLERGVLREREELVPSRYEIKLLTKSGDERWVELSAAYFEFDGLPATLATGIDITERKQAEEAVRQHEEQMTHVVRVATVGEMASGLAHELSQPLTAILYFAQGCSRALRAGTRGTAEALDTLQKIAVQAERAGEFIRRLKDFVRKAAPSACRRT